MWILGAKMKALAKGWKVTLERAKYLKRGRKRKETKSRKEKRQMCTYARHAVQVKIKTIPYIISSVVFCAKRKYDKLYSMEQIPSPGVMLIPKTSDIWQTPHIPVKLQQQNKLNLFNFVSHPVWINSFNLLILSLTNAHYLLCLNHIILGWQIKVEKISHIWLQFISLSCSVHKSKRERDISPTTSCLFLLKWQMKQT